MTEVFGAISRPDETGSSRVDPLRVVTALLFAGMVLFSMTHVFEFFIDYPVYELAGRRVLEGRPLELYDLARTTSGGFYYPYFFALCFAPLAALGTLPGKLLYFAVFWLCYWRLLTFSLDCAAELVPAAAEHRNRALLAVGVTVAAINPLNDVFISANLGLPLAAMVVQAWIWRDRRPAWAGGLLGAAIAMKVYPVIILGWFIWARHWRAAAAAIIVFGVLYLCPLLFYGPQVGLLLLRNQAAVLERYGSHYPYDSLAFQNLSGTLMRWGSMAGLPPSAIFRVVTKAAAVAMIAFYLPSFLRPSDTLDRDFRLRMFVLTLALVPVIVPVSWYNMALFYLPLLAIFLACVLTAGDRVAAWVVAAFFAGFTLIGRDVVGRPLTERLQLAGIPFLTAATVVGLFLIRLVRANRDKFRLIPRPD
jgi:alpha-1,2-mannosyltransferase